MSRTLRRWLSGGEILLMIAGLGGCLRRPPAMSPGDPDVGVLVTWHGHACFSIEDSVGRKILLDPFDETVGYAPVWPDPDAVLVTDDHFDRNAVRRSGRYDLVVSTGVTTAAGIEVTGLTADHDDAGGRINGMTRIYAWEMGGIRFGNLGGIGQDSLRPEQIRLLKGVDVLFVPVGGGVTVNAPRAAALVREISPRVVVPMVYGNEKLRGFVLDPVDPFLTLFKNVLELPDNRFQVQRGSLPDQLSVYVPALPE